MQQIYQLIRLNRYIRSYRIKFLGVLLADIFGLRHLFLRLDPVNACNLKCSMCYFSDRDYAKKIRGRLSSDELDRIAKLFFPRTLQLVVGCAAVGVGVHKPREHVLRDGREGARRELRDVLLDHRDAPRAAHHRARVVRRGAQLRGREQRRTFRERHVHVRVLDERRRADPA